MGTEIERKWRLKELPQRVASTITPHHITQGYLVISEQGEVRLRIEDRSYYLTFKGSGTISRPEENYQLISKMGFDLLWPKIIGAAIEKLRYDYPQGADILQFDVPSGFLEGYFSLEVEFDDLEGAQAFVLPEWIEGAVETTDDKRYKAKYLSLHHETIRQQLRF